jgi:hypothetical protein
MLPHPTASLAMQHESRRFRVRPLPPRRHFLRKLAHNVSFAAVLIAASLLLGTLGYHWTERLPWIDSLLNASMILTGMGPVSPLTNASAKLFATFYALFSGTVFLTTAALVLIPVAHRVLHRFHLELEEGQAPQKPSQNPPPNHPQSAPLPSVPSDP